MEFWIIDIIDHLQDVTTTNNYNTIAEFHTLQITTVHAVFSKMQCIH
jgi:hypothetical protein